MLSAMATIQLKQEMLSALDHVVWCAELALRKAENPLAYAMLENVKQQVRSLKAVIPTVDIELESLKEIGDRLGGMLPTSVAVKLWRELKQDADNNQLKPIFRQIKQGPPLYTPSVFAKCKQHGATGKPRKIKRGSKGVRTNAAAKRRARSR
jgi:hypothetical protein